NKRNLSSALVVAQVAISIVLVMLAGLFIRTFSSLNHVPLGFDPGRLFVMNIYAPPREGGIGNQLAYFQELLRTVQETPGVLRAAGSNGTPVSGAGMSGQVRLRINGILAPGGGAFITFVTPGWFRTYGMRISTGRDIDERDIRGAGRVAVVNQAFVRKY